MMVFRTMNTSVKLRRSDFSFYHLLFKLDAVVIRMEKKTRKKVVAHLRNILKENAFGDNKDFRDLVEKAVRQPYRIMDENDEFCFNPDKCVTDCDGRCCMVIDMVRVTPVDVDYMMNSPVIQKTGMTRKEMVEKTLDVMLGHVSRVPLSVIRMVSFNKPEVGQLRLCPFMRVVQKISVDLGKNGIKLEDSGRGGVCMLGQEYKPTICMLYPLGRFTSIHMDDDEDVDTIYVRLDCEGTKTAKKTNVKEWIGDYEEKDDINKRYINVMSTLINRLNDEVGDPRFTDFIMQKMAALFYYQEGDTKSKLNTVEHTMNELITIGKQAIKETEDEADDRGS